MVVWISSFGRVGPLLLGGCTYGRVDLALVVECLYLYARMLPIGLCDSTLTMVVPPGSLMVADKHNWSREVTCGRLD